MKLFDKNYEELYVGADVEVPTPTNEDNWNFEFKGTETRVYVVNQEDSEKEVQNLTDEEFMDIAEQWGRVYTLQGFQETFNNQKDEVSHSEDFIRFINVPNFE